MTTAKPRITIERTYPATLDEVWELWTTKEGIEAWWGPEGFSVEVVSMDLRPGGDLRYAMTAVGPDQIAFMKNAGAPLTTLTSLRYTDVQPSRRLAYRTLADFVPGVDPYAVQTEIEFRAIAPGQVRIVVTSDAMHDDQWTRLATMGRESELRKLEQLLASRRQ